MGRSGFEEVVISKAKKDPKRVVFPEGTEERVLKAAEIVSRKKIARPIILGDEEKISEEIKRLGINKEGITIINPAGAANLSDYADTFYNLRKHKGVSQEDAKKTLKNSMYYGTMMVYKGDADGLVSGSVHSSADTIRPALQIIKTRKGVSLVSGIFFMVLKDKTYAFADCGVVANPSAEELAEIAVVSALTAKHFGIKPYVAMLSYSTKGSASGPLTEKVVKATEIAKKKLEEEYPDESDIEIDGELQADAAIVPEVARRKAPASEVAGKAEVLIFPDLNVGNVSYKFVERLAGAKAYGPILQGLARPVNDLSRGCCVDDIVGVTAITVVQAQEQSL